MYAAIYVCVLIALYVENQEVTLMPLILVQYCTIRNLFTVPFSDGEEPGSPSLSLFTYLIRPPG